MGSDYRVLGRDTNLRLTQNGILLAETQAISNVDFKLVQTVISSGFLGEVAKRHREVFDEVDASWTLEPEGVQVFEMVNAIYTRARSGMASTVQINLMFRLLFGNGAICRMTIPDLKFATNGDVNNGGRDTFVKMAFAAKSDRYILSV
jgi:hypothetical protein